MSLVLRTTSRQRTAGEAHLRHLLANTHFTRPAGRWQDDPRSDFEHEALDKVGALQPEGIEDGTCAWRFPEINHPEIERRSNARIMRHFRRRLELCKGTVLANRPGLALQATATGARRWRRTQPAPVAPVRPAAPISTPAPRGVPPAIHQAATAVGAQHNRFYLAPTARGVRVAGQVYVHDNPVTATRAMRAHLERAGYSCHDGRAPRAGYSAPTFHVSLPPGPDSLRGGSQEIEVHSAVEKQRTAAAEQKQADSAVEPKLRGAPSVPKPPETEAGLNQRLKAAGIKDASGKHFTEAHFKRMLDHDATQTHGLKTVVHSVKFDDDDKHVRAEGHVLDKQGKRVGDFRRYFHFKKDGTPDVVDHDHFHLDKAHQNHGFAGEWLAHAEANYQKHGFKAVRLMANLDVGGYAWAKHGFDFADRNVRDEMRGEFRVKLGNLRLPSAVHQKLRDEIGKLHHSWEFAAWPGHDHQHAKELGADFGKKAMLGGIWEGVKSLSPNSRSFKVGTHYRDLKKKLMGRMSKGVARLTLHKARFANQPGYRLDRTKHRWVGHRPRYNRQVRIVPTSTGLAVRFLPLRPRPVLSPEQRLRLYNQAVRLYTELVRRWTNEYDSRGQTPPQRMGKYERVLLRAYERAYRRLDGIGLMEPSTLPQAAVVAAHQRVAQQPLLSKSRRGPRYRMVLQRGGQRRAGALTKGIANTKGTYHYEANKRVSGPASANANPHGIHIHPHAHGYFVVHQATRFADAFKVRSAVAPHIDVMQRVTADPGTVARLGGHAGLDISIGHEAGQVALRHAYPHATWHTRQSSEKSRLRPPKMAKSIRALHKATSLKNRPGLSLRASKSGPLRWQKITISHHVDKYHVDSPYNGGFIAGVKQLPWADRKWEDNVWKVHEKHEDVLHQLLRQHYGFDITQAGGGGTGQKAAPVVPAEDELSDDEIRAVHAGLRHLAGFDPDGARERNNVGFNGMHSEFGRDLARKPGLTQRQAQAGKKMLRTYRNTQLPQDIVDTLFNRKPPTAKAKAKQTADRAEALAQAERIKVQAAKEVKDAAAKQSKVAAQRQAIEEKLLTPAERAHHYDVLHLSTQELAEHNRLNEWERGFLKDKLGKDRKSFSTQQNVVLDKIQKTHADYLAAHPARKKQYYASYLARNKDRLEAEARTKAEREGALSAQTTDKLTLPPGINKDVLYKGNLFKHQRMAVNWLMHIHRGVLALSTGLGKTNSAVVAFEKLRQQGQAKRMLWVVPKARIEGTAEDIQALFPKRKVVIIKGTPAQREAQWKAAAKVDYVVCGYHFVRTEAQRLKGLGVDTVAFDESVRLKGRNSQVAKQARDVLGDLPYVWYLSATPIPNSPEDLFNIMEGIKPGMFGAFAKFKKDHCVVAANKWAPGGTIVGYSDKKATNALIAPYFMHRDYDDPDVDVGEIGQKQRLRLGVDMTPDVSKVYEALQRGALQDALAGGAAKFNTANALTVLLRLEQISISPRLLDPTYKGDEPKLEQATDIIADHFQGGQKKAAIVFSRFLGVQPLMHERLVDAGIAPAEIAQIQGSKYLVGGKPVKSVQDVVNAVNSGKVKVLLASDSAAEGLNIQHNANLLIHLDTPWRPDVILQREGRIYRPGQKDVNTHIRLLMNNGIDAYKDKVVTRKAVDMQAVVADKDISDTPDKLTYEDYIALLGGKPGAAKPSAPKAAAKTKGAK